MIPALAELAEALRGILPMAREGQRARVSPSSHQAFIQDDLDDIRMAEKAIAKYDSAQSAPETWDTPVQALRKIDGFCAATINSQLGARFIIDIQREARQALAKYDATQSAPETRDTPVQAIKALREHQEQLDTDGVMVGVSRQALDEVLAFLQSAPERGGDEVYTQEDLDRADAKAAEIIAAIPVDDV